MQPRHLDPDAILQRAKSDLNQNTIGAATLGFGLLGFFAGALFYGEWLAAGELLLGLTLGMALRGFLRSRTDAKDRIDRLSGNS